MSVGDLYREYFQEKRIAKVKFGVSNRCRPSDCT